MVVHQLLLTPAEQADHFARDPLAPRVGVASGQIHELPVGVPHRARDVEQRLALGHALDVRSEEHTSELQSLAYLVCRLLLEKKKKNKKETENTKCVRRHPRS